MTRLFRLSVVALAIALLSSSSHAGVRYFLSTSDARPGGGAAAAPSLADLTPGQEIDLHIWAAFDGANQFVNGYSLDLFATEPGVVEAVSSTILNPNYVFNVPGVGQFPSTGQRWPAGTSTLFEQPQLNASGALLFGGAAGIVDGRGIDKAVGINPATASGTLDPLYDATNSAFLLQSLKLKVLDGAAGKSTGLVMHIGGRAMGVDNATTPQQIFFGTGATSVRNDIPGATDGSIHASLAVAGGGRANVFEFGGDPTGATSVPFAGVQPIDLPIDAPAGKLLIDDAWLRNGNFEIYFDLSFSDPGTDVDDVIAMLQGQQIDALPGRSLGNGVAYDLRIVVPGLPGNDLLMDFDFTAGGLAGVNVESVGVPEPSSFVLAGLGCVGLLAFRRRKA